MDRPLLELSHDELLAAAGFMFIELNAARGQLDRLEAALNAANLQVVDVDVELEPEDTMPPAPLDPS